MPDFKAKKETMKHITIAAAVLAMAVIASSPVFAKDQPESKTQENALDIPLRTKATSKSMTTDDVASPETIIAEMPLDDDLVLDQESSPEVLSILRVNGI